MGFSLATSAWVAIATVVLIVMAILIIVAGDRVRNISGFDSNDNLKSANNRLVTAQILAWIAVGLGLLLTIGYLFLHGGFINTEWIHLILWILLFAAIIVSGIFLAIAISDIDNANVSDNKGSVGYIWGALGAGAGALVLLIISGGWRIVHKQSELTPQQYYMLHDITNGVPTDAGEVPPSGTTPQVQVTTQPGTTVTTV